MGKNRFNWGALIMAIVGFGFCIWKAFYIESVAEIVLLVIIARMSWGCACNIEQSPKEVEADRAYRKLVVQAAKRRFGPLWVAIEAAGPLCVVLAGVLAVTVGQKWKYLILALYIGGLFLMCVLSYLVKDEINTIQKEEKFRKTAEDKPPFFNQRPNEDDP